MSELKAASIFDVYWKATSNGDNSVPVYLKSEADAVIEELKEIDSKNRSAYYKDLAMMAKDVERQKYKRCLAMSECREAQSRWCYQAANTLPPGVIATLNGKPVMVEPRQLFIRSGRLLLASGLWKRRSEKFKEAK